ncbi:MAG: amidohydrolase family protein, partial [Ilumatobacteraceae bacterium]
MTARLFTGGRLLRPDPAPAAIDSLAVAGGNIIAVGTEAQCRAALPADAEVVQLDRAVLAPGFVDTHLHPMVMSVFEQQLVLDSATSIAEVLDAVRDQARTTDAGRAVIGFQLDDARLAERRLPTAAELQA